MNGFGSSSGGFGGSGSSSGSFDPNSFVGKK